MINIPEEKKTLIQDAIGVLQKELTPYLKTLTSEEKKSILKIGEKTLGFVSKCLEHAIHNQELVPNFLNLDAFKKDFELYIELKNMYNSISQIASMLEDTNCLIGSETFESAFLFYGNVKSAEKAKVSKAKEIYDDLSARYSYRVKNTPKKNEEVSK